MVLYDVWCLLPCSHGARTSVAFCLQHLCLHTVLEAPHGPDRREQHLQRVRRLHAALLCNFRLCGWYLSIMLYKEGVLTVLCAGASCVLHVFVLRVACCVCCVLRVFVLRVACVRVACCLCSFFLCFGVCFSIRNFGAVVQTDKGLRIPGRRCNDQNTHSATNYEYYMRKAFDVLEVRPAMCL